MVVILDTPFCIFFWFVLKYYSLTPDIKIRAQKKKSGYRRSKSQILQLDDLILLVQPSTLVFYAVVQEAENN